MSAPTFGKRRQFVCAIVIAARRLFFVGMPKRVEYAAPALAFGESMSRYFPHAAVLLALLLAAAAPGQDDPPGNKDKVPDGLKALRDPDPNVRIRAAQILGSLGKTSRFAVPELREALKDKDGRVRVRVAEALWRIEQMSPSILLPVLEGALHDKQVGVRILAP